MTDTAHNPVSAAAKHAATLGTAGANHIAGLWQAERDRLKALAEEWEANACTYAVTGGGAMSLHPQWADCARELRAALNHAENAPKTPPAAPQGSERDNPAQISDEPSEAIVATNQPVDQTTP